MKKRKFVNSSKTTKIKDLEKKFDSNKDLERQIKELKGNNHQKAKEIIDLKEHIENLEIKIEKSQAEVEMSDEYVIALFELERMKKTQKERAFSIDEIRAFDTLVKIKRLCSGQSTQNLHPPKKTTKPTPDSSLIQIISAKK